MSTTSATLRGFKAPLIGHKTFVCFLGWPVFPQASRAAHVNNFVGFSHVIFMVYSGGVTPSTVISPKHVEQSLEQCPLGLPRPNDFSQIALVDECGGSIRTMLAEVISNPCFYFEELGGSLAGLLPRKKPTFCPGSVGQNQSMEEVRDENRSHLT